MDIRVSNPKLSQRMPYTVILPTIYGNMLVNRNDINQTNCLLKTGRPEGFVEIEIIRRLLDLVDAETKVFMDVGANIGTHTIAIAQHLETCGKVYAFEPQRLVYQMLCGTLALNSITNVWCHNVAVGAEKKEIALPQFDYFRPLNFGSIEFGDVQTEKLHQERGHDPAKDEFVPMVTVDSFGLADLHVLKIDVEGMEVQVLEGARDTIARTLPLMIIEYLKTDHRELGIKLLELGYRVYIHDIVFVCISPRYKGLAIDGFRQFVL